MEPFQAHPGTANDDTPPAPFARPRTRARGGGQDLPPELSTGFVGDYSLEAQIGQGGMSWMFRARKLGEEPVALKVLDPALARDHGPDLVARFFREAETSTRLRHPNIVAGLAHGTCEQTGAHYIALEYVPGHSVEDILNIQGGLAESDALNVTLGVAQALAWLESQGVIHRDVKPSNILIDASGTAKLADFGVAKVLASSALTMAGAMVGTPHYIAPEQAIGIEQLDIRADLYSLGITLFRMVTGAFPFEGEGFLDIVTRHVNEDVPDPRSVNASVTAETARLVASLAARDPGDRYPSAKAAAEDVARVMLGHTVQGVRSGGLQGAAPARPAAPAAVQGARAAPTAPAPPVSAATGRPLPPTVFGPAAELVAPRSRVPEEVAPAAAPTAPPPASSPPTRRVTDRPGGPPTSRSRPPTTVGPRPPSGRHPAAPPRPPTLRLVVRTGNNVLSRKKIDKDVITVGRDPRCDIHIDNPMVSRNHCEVRRSGNHVKVVERNNTNGTYVNGDRVRGASEVRPGDVIGITKKFDIEVTWDAVPALAVATAAPAPAAPVVEPEPPPDEPDPAEQTFFDDGSGETGTDTGYEDDPYGPRPDRAERERAEREQADRLERAERERAERDRPERDRAERDRAERDRAERDRAERDRAEGVERERRDRTEGAERGEARTAAHARQGDAPRATGRHARPGSEIAPSAGLAPGRPAPGIPPTAGHNLPGPRRGIVLFSRGGKDQRQTIQEYFQCGRSQECDLRLESSFAPRKAFVITRGPRDHHLFNVAPYPQTIQVNGKAVDDVTILRHGDRISAYGVELAFELE